MFLLNKRASDLENKNRLNSLLLGLDIPTNNLELIKTDKIKRHQQCDIMFGCAFGKWIPTHTDTHYLGYSEEDKLWFNVECIDYHGLFGQPRTHQDVCHENLSATKQELETANKLLTIAAKSSGLPLANATIQAVDSAISINKQSSRYLLTENIISGDTIENTSKEAGSNLAHFGSTYNFLGHPTIWFLVVLKSSVNLQTLRTQYREQVISLFENNKENDNKIVIITSDNRDLRAVGEGNKTTGNGIWIQNPCTKSSCYDEEF